MPVACLCLFCLSQCSQFPPREGDGDSAVTLPWNSAGSHVQDQMEPGDCAGISARGTPEWLAGQDFMNTPDVNLLGVLKMTLSLLPAEKGQWPCGQHPQPHWAGASGYSSPAFWPLDLGVERTGHRCPLWMLWVS